MDDAITPHRKARDCTVILKRVGRHETALPQKMLFEMEAKAPKGKGGRRKERVAERDSLRN